MSPTFAVPSHALIKDGEPVAVIRPNDPLKAIVQTADILDRERLGRITPQRAEKELHVLIEKGAYRFIGFLRKDLEAVLSLAGSEKPLRQGDQYLSLSQLKRFPTIYGRDN